MTTANKSTPDISIDNQEGGLPVETPSTTSETSEAKPKESFLKKAGQKLLYVVLEASLVVLGVVLAYSINATKEHSDKLEQSQQALKGIYEEVEQNRQMFSEAITYHQYLVDTLQTFFPTPRVPGRRVFYNGFIARKTALTTAWDAAQSNELLYKVDYEEILRLSDLYDRLDNYNTIKETQSKLIYTQIYNDGLQAVSANYRNLFQLVMGNLFVEREIMQKFEHVQSQMKDDG